MTIPDLWSDITSFGTLLSPWTELPVVNTTVLRDGWIVATWLDGNSGVYKGQILNVDGTPFGQAFEIGAAGSSIARAPSVAALPNGRFIVAYNRYDGGNNHTLIQKTFDAFDGLIDENAIASANVTGGLNPSVNVFADGSFDITYNDGGIKYFRYSDSGSSYGTVSSSVLNIGKSAVSQNTFANLEYSDQKLYLTVSFANGFRILKTAVADFASFELAQTSDVTALADGTFAVTFVQNTATTGSLKANIFYPDGRFKQTLILYESNKPLGSTAVQHLSGSDFAFSVIDGDATGPLHVGTFRDGWVDQWDMPTANALHPEIVALNDGRFLVQWMTATTGGPAQVAIYDPRTAAINWTGDEIGQQYAGTKFGDQLHGGDGADTLYGAGGDDGLSGDGGNDTLYGGTGNDTLEGGDGNDRLDGGAGADYLDGGSDDDTVTYIAMTSGVIVDLSTNNNGGAAAGDILVNIEVVEGTNQADTLIGVKLANGNGVTLWGKGGNDHLIGKDGADHLDGGEGNDTLFGGLGSDTLDGGAGIDMVSYYGMSSGVTVDLSNNVNNAGAAKGDILIGIEAVQGTDSSDTLTGIDLGGGKGVELYGMGGSDSLAGGNGSDRLEGGDGNDTLNGGGSGDVMAGGKGDDVYYVDSANDVVYEQGDEGTDTVHSWVSFDIAAWAIENVILEGTADVNIVGNLYANILTGNAGNNRIVAAEGNDTVKGGDGNDTLIGGAGADLLDGEGGTNRVSYATSSEGVTVDLGTGIGKYGDAEGDRLVNIQQLEGSNHADTFTASAAGNLISGLDGNDTIIGAGGEDVLGGDAGDDVLDGGGAHDVLYGGAGNDTMTGGAGNDYLDGEDGVDTAKFSGSYASYSIVENADGTFTVKGHDGEDTLKNIEFADFNGQIVRLAPGGANLAPIIDGLSNNTVDEDKAPSTAIGTFSAHDPEDGTTGLVYELKDAQGNAADAGGLFAVDVTGHLTVAKALPDGAGDQTFTVTLKVSDKNGGAGSAASYQTFTITVKDVVAGNHAPDNLTLNGGTEVRVNENAAFSGNLLAHDADGDAVTWSFDNTAAGNANGLFEIVDDGNGHKQLKLKAGIDYEALPANQKYVTVAMKASDGKPGGTSATQIFKINVADVDETSPANHAPTGLSLSGATASEYAAAGTLAGTLSTSDADSDALFYTLLDNAGGRFMLSGNQILVADGFRLDFEQAKSHNVTVQVTDGHGGVASQVFSIGVNDVNPEVTAGTAGNDVFKGGAKNDKLGGGAGNDQLWGGLGNDTLTGGKGKDIFVFDTKLNGKKNKDLIKDYSVKDDTLWLDNALFKSNKTLYAAIKKGTEAKPVKLAAKFFALDTAKDKDDFFVYDSHKHVLYYDADGSGSKPGVAIASFTNNKALKGFSYKEMLFI